MKYTQALLAGILVAGLPACGAVDAGVRAATDYAEQDPEGEAVAALPGDLVPIRVGGIEIQVEIADDGAERAQGLMRRESLPEMQGMLFVYNREQTLGFWMKDTLIPLDIAYADREGRIVDIQQMEPQTLETHDSAAPAMYALEMNQGWFERHGVRIGDLIEF